MVKINHLRKLNPVKSSCYIMAVCIATCIGDSSGYSIVNLKHAYAAGHEFTAWYYPVYTTLHGWYLNTVNLEIFVVKIFL